MAEAVNKERVRPRPRAVIAALFWGILGGQMFSSLLVIRLLGAPHWVGLVTFFALTAGFVWLDLFDPEDPRPVSWARYRAGSRSAAKDYDESR